MSNPGVINLAETVIGGESLRVEDNIGEAIHIHYGQIRIDMTIKEFTAFSEKLTDIAQNMINIPGFSIKDYDAIFLTDASEILCDLSGVDFMEVSVGELKTDSVSEDFAGLVPLQDARIMRALNGNSDANDARKQKNYWGENNASRLANIYESIKKNGYNPSVYGNYIVLIDNGRYIIDGCHRASSILKLRGNVQIPVAMWHTKDGYFTDSHKENELKHCVMQNTTFQEFKQFCKKRHHLYLYGAGDFGRKYLRLLRCINVEPSGFLVSKRENTGKFLSLPVLLWSDVKDDLPDDTGIILAVSKKNVPQILTNIEDKHFDIFSMKDDYIKQLETFVTHEYSFIERAAENKERTSFLRIDPKLPEWQSVLVMRFDLIGDNLENMPFLRELRRNLPNSRIVMLARAGLEDLYDCCPYVDETIYYDVDGWTDCEHLRDFAEQNLQGFGTVILTRLRSYPNEYTAEEMLLMLYTSAWHRLTWDMKETEYSSIYNDIYSDFFSFWDVIDKDIHHVQYMLAFLQNLGAEISNEKMEAWIVSDANVWAEAWINKQNLSSNKLLAAVALVGSAPYKNYPPRLFQLILQKLSQTYPRLMFILLGGSDAVGAAGKLGQVPYVLDLTGKTSLAQSMAIISKCDFYLGEDTGLMHMAAAFNKPVVEISSELPDAKFNDTSCHHFTGAFGVPTKVCMASSGLDGCSRQCVVGKPHCITQILSDEIVDAVKSLLEECGLVRLKG